MNSVWFINKDTGFVVGDSGIVLRTYTGGVIVGVNNNNEIISNEFLLHQNYPNPFNPSTEIRFDLPEAVFVTLKVYDITGKEVAELLNEIKNVGRHSIKFDAANLSSGIYYYKLKAGSYSSVKKMLLIK